jgi:GT2 family glycosyltransferase
METGKVPLVYFVVLNWNQAEMTSDCLNSLAKQDYASFQVVVVDNGSKDGSASVLRERFPWVTLLEIPENIGYDLSNNVGIDYAMGQGADYIFLLNNDTEVDAHMLSYLVKAAESDPHIGILGPKLYFFDQPNIIASAGGMIDWRRGEACQLQYGVLDRNGLLDGTNTMDGAPSQIQAIPSPYGEKYRYSREGRTGDPCQVDYVISCAVCAKREVVEKIGGLDPRFFIMNEDIDWCVQAARQGYRTMYVPKAKVWHKLSATMGTGSPALIYFITRNDFLFFWKHLGFWSRLSPTLWNLYRAVRTTLAWSLKSEYRGLRRQRIARILAVRDAFLGRTGDMAPDVRAICYPDSKR